MNNSMPSAAFVSYSHRDEKMLDRLHKHLAMLQRDGLLAVWHDRKIDAGGEIDKEIRDSFVNSDLFLALVSPDFLASNYCYEKEMLAAIERSESGTMTIVPIVLEPCDWKSSPLARFKALPKDGLPISEWINENLAFLDVVSELRRLIDRKPVRFAAGEPEQAATPRAERPNRQVRLKRDFDSIEKSYFRDSAFETIRKYFESSVAEINQIGDSLRAKYENINSTGFTATVVNRAMRNGESHITIHNHKAHGIGDITYTHVSHGGPNQANGIVMVHADEHQLYLTAETFRGGARDQKLTAEQVAEQIWNDFIARAGIDYA